MVNLVTCSTSSFSEGEGFSIISSKTESSAEETVSPHEQQRSQHSQFESKTNDDPSMSKVAVDVVPVSRDK